ncbi:MAG: tRNA pseudouridine(55) synthase TruB [Eubacteriales bacterium]
MTTGILVVDKPEDWTSHDVVAKLRGVFREKRVGHAGTLDPLATGVLPVFFGRATRVVEFAMDTEKEYVAGLRLGQTTDTQDITGRVLTETPQHCSKEELEAVLYKFRGDIMQIPPMYSAIKIQGKKLYELARQGKEVERPPRSIRIFDLELLPDLSEEGDFLLRIQCSKGTYVRTLCHDIGQVLGCGGVMSSLRRTTAAGFSIAEAYPLMEIIDAPEGKLLPVDSYFKEEKMIVEDWQEKKIRNGADFLVKDGIPEGQYRLYGTEFLGLGEVKEGKVHCIKSFFEVGV